jgi:hypothetical protein
MATLIACAPWEHPRRRRRAAVVSVCKELGTNRIPCDKSPPSEVAKRRVERDRGRGDDARERAIGKTRHGVLLQQQRWNPSKRGNRDNDNRTGAVTADSDHEVRLPARDDPPGIDPADRQQCEAAHNRRG